MSRRKEAKKIIAAFKAKPDHHKVNCPPKSEWLNEKAATEISIKNCVQPLQIQNGMIKSSPNFRAGQPCQNENIYPKENN